MKCINGWWVGICKFQSCPWLCAVVVGIEWRKKSWEWDTRLWKMNTEFGLQNYLNSTSYFPIYLSCISRKTKERQEFTGFFTLGGENKTMNCKFLQQQSRLGFGKFQLLRALYFSDTIIPGLQIPPYIPPAGHVNEYPEFILNHLKPKQQSKSGLKENQEWWWIV